MDTDVGRWILESLPLEPLDDHLLYFLINILPLPNDDPVLKTSLLLRKLETEVANQSISETLLDLLQHIQELGLEAGDAEPLCSIRAAYLAVAVVCTVKFLRDSGDSIRREYFCAVKRIWRERVCKLETTKATGLISDEWWSWKNDIEEALWEDSACSSVLKRSQGVDAMEALSLYVKEKRGKMRPFLESIDDLFRTDEELTSLCGNICKAWDKGMYLQGAGQHAGPSHEKRVSRRFMLVPPTEMLKGAFAGTNRGANFDNMDTSDGVVSCKKYDLPPTPEVNRVLKALELSSLELQRVVEDPLPDSLRIAENVVFYFSGKENAVSEITRMNTTKESMEEHLRRADHPDVRGSQRTHASGENMPKHSHWPQNNVSKSSLMARNGTACSFEWDDDVSWNSPNGGRGSRVQLPSPKSRPAVSPLKPYVSCKLTRRRQIRKWSGLEADTLRAGVQRFGKGSWVTILEAYKDVFEERTSVDLKDKWRNMNREK